jgi:hypothetical protein
MAHLRLIALALFVVGGLVVIALAEHLHSKRTARRLQKGSLMRATVAAELRRQARRLEAEID